MTFVPFFFSLKIEEAEWRNFSVHTKEGLHIVPHIYTEGIVLLETQNNPLAPSQISSVHPQHLHI